MQVNGQMLAKTPTFLSLFTDQTLRKVSATITLQINIMKFWGITSKTARSIPGVI